MCNAPNPRGDGTRGWRRDCAVGIGILVPTPRRSAPVESRLLPPAPARSNELRVTFALQFGSVWGKNERVDAS